MGGRRGAVVAVVLLLVGGAGYAAGDVYDVVPGPLTASPAPAPPEPFPTAPGAALPGDADPVLAGVGTDAPLPSPSALAQTLSPLLADPGLGAGVSADVVDALTGERLFALDPQTAREPASVAKLLTAAAALHRLGPRSTTSTRAVQGVAPDEVVLLGGGDVLLAAGAGDERATNGHAGLADLAAATARRLLDNGRSAVAVRLDDAIFTGPRLGPGWTQSDVDAGFVAPVTGIAVDAGRTAPQTYAPREPDPGLAAATTFAQALATNGVRVVGPVARAVAPPDPAVLAEVRSAPLADVVAYLLTTSDNNVEEATARLVARHMGRPTAFADAARAVLDEVSVLGLDTSAAKLVDGSGLGTGSRLPAVLITGLLSAAASPDHPELRPLLTGLPVAGLTGTLSDRFAHQPAGAGLVRGKTGSLLGVSSLAGTVVDADGRLLAFAVLADQVPATEAARDALDAVAAALAGCGCR